MSDSPDHLTITAHYSRKVSDGNYGSTEVGGFVQIPVSLDADSATRRAALDEALNEAESCVAAAIGGDTAPFTASVTPIAASVNTTFPGAITVSGGDVPDSPRDYSGSEKDWAKAKITEFLASGDSRLGEWFFDNRFDKRNPKAPDFKGKRNGPAADIAVWID